MRSLSWTTLAVGLMLAAGPIQAQTYDPNFPICLQTYGRDGGYIACRYTSMGQCKLTASARAAQCIVNPYFAGAAGRSYRKQRRLYD